MARAGGESMSQGSNGNVLRGMVVGAIGGVVGTWAMATSQELWNRIGFAWADDTEDRSEWARRLGHAGEGRGRHAQGEPRSHHHEETAGHRAVGALVKRATGRRATAREKEVGGSLLHYGFGAVAGAVYGALAQEWPGVTMGKGTAYGAAVWLAADEVAMPMTGFAPSPTETPPERHAYALWGHLAFGIALEMTRRLLNGSAHQRH